MNIIKSPADRINLQSTALWMQSHWKMERALFRLGCWLKKEVFLFPPTGEGAGLTALKSDLFIQSNAGSNGTHSFQCAQLCIYFQFHQ